MFVYFVSKVFTYLLLPPGIFVLVFVFAFFVSRRFKWLFLFFALFLWFISTTIGRDLLLDPLEHIKRSNNLKAVRAVVVLSGGSNSKGVIRTYPEAFERLVYGYIVACKKNFPLIITGGGIVTNDSKNMLKDLKTLETVTRCRPRVILESESLNTYQNAKFTAKLFSRMGIKKDICLVTSFYHMKRAILIFSHFGFKVIPEPVEFLRNTSYTWLDFLPQMKNLYYSYKAIHEYVGILSLKLAWIF